MDPSYHRSVTARRRQRWIRFLAIGVAVLLSIVTLGQVVGRIVLAWINS